MLELRAKRAAVLSPRSSIALLIARPTVTVAPTATLMEAAAAMRGAGVSALLVDGASAIITERDITQAVADGKDADVATVATPNPVTVDADCSIADAGFVMLSFEVRHLVVRFPDEQVGVVSQRDIVNVLLQFAGDQQWAPLLQTLSGPTETWLG